MKSCEEKGAFCSYVVVQIKGQKEEDRASYRLTHANPQEGGLKSVASFGVFDGHSSKKAAEECSKRLNNQIVLAYAELLTTTGLVGTLKQDPIGLVNTNLVSDAASNRANQDRTFLAPAKGIAGSAHGSVTSSTHHSDVVNLTREREATVQKKGTKEIIAIDDDSSSDESGFKKDSEVWNTAGDQDSYNAKLGSVLDDSTHSAGSAHLSQTGFSSLEAKLVPSPTSTPLSTPRSSSHGASKNSRSQSPSRASGSIPEEDTREREMMKDDILHTAKQMFVHDVHDALFTEAILKETYNVDKAIKAMTNSGSTGVSLFLRKQANGSVRALCSNIGDSRCVCVTAVATLIETQNLGPQSEPRHAPVKSSSSTSSSSSSAHITTASSSRADEATEIKHQNTYYNDLLAARKFDAVSAATNVKGEDIGNRARTVSDVSDVMCESERPDYLFAVRTTNSTLFLMSEDHNLTLPRERLRIMSRTLPPWSPLPVESFEPYLPANMRSGMLLSSTSEPVSIFEVGALIARKVNPYPGNDFSLASEDTHSTGSDGMKQSSTTSSPLSLGKSTKWNSSVHLSAMIDRESDLENELVRRSSFSELGDLSLSNSAVAAAGSVESQFYKNSPKLATRKSLRGSSSSEQLVQTSNGNDPISKSKRAGLDGPPVNLAAAIGVGKVVMAHYARLAARYYLETAPSKQVLASKFIKKVRRLMNRYGTPSAGWNGSTSQVSLDVHIFTSCNKFLTRPLLFFSLPKAFQRPQCR